MSIPSHLKNKIFIILLREFWENFSFYEINLANKYLIYSKKFHIMQKTQKNIFFANISLKFINFNKFLVIYKNF